MRFTILETGIRWNSARSLTWSQKASAGRRTSKFSPTNLVMCLGPAQISPKRDNFLDIIQKPVLQKESKIPWTGFSNLGYKVTANTYIMIRVVRTNETILTSRHTCSLPSKPSFLLGKLAFLKHQILHWAYEKEPDQKSSQSFCFKGRPFMIQKVLRKEDSRMFCKSVVLESQNLEVKSCTVHSNSKCFLKIFRYSTFTF